MTPGPVLTEVLAEYQTGLEAELRLLTQLRQLSTAQHDAGQTRAVRRLATIGARRDELMTALVALEDRLKPLRQTLAAHRTALVTLPGYRKTLTLHRQAETLVREITDADQQTVAALEQAASTRRLAHEMITRGQASLDAYRRVVLPASLPAALFNRRS